MTGVGIVILVSYFKYNNIFVELGINTLIITGFIGFTEYRDRAISILFKKDL